MIHIWPSEYCATYVQRRPLLLERFYNCFSSLRHPVDKKGNPHICQRVIVPIVEPPAVCLGEWWIETRRRLTDTYHGIPGINHVPSLVAKSAT